MPQSTARASVNQVVQIGPETTPGTTVAATKIIEATDIQPGIKAEFKQFRAQGRKYSAQSVIGKEWTDIKLSGTLSYNEMAYWLCSSAQSVTPTTHTAGTLSKDWTFAPTLTGNTNVQTFTVEKGDAATRAYKFGYGLVTGFAAGVTRDATTFTGAMIGQRLTDGITLTPSLSPVGIAPVLAQHANIYMDTTAGGIGTTQVLDALAAEFMYDTAYGTEWTLNRSNNSFAKHVDLAPKCEFKVKMEADTVGMSPLAGARLGSTYYFSYDFTGPIIEGAIPYHLVFKFAGEVSAIAPFADDNGVYAIEWTFTITDDQTLGYAWNALLTNAIASL